MEPAHWLRSSARECAVDAAGLRHARRIETRAIVESHIARRNHARARREVLEIIVRRDKSPARREHFHRQFSRVLIGKPSGKVRGKFSARDKHLVSCLPIDACRNSR